MEDRIKADADVSEALKNKLLAIVEKGVRLANRNVGYVRNLVVLGILAGAWLAYYVNASWSPPLSLALPVFVVLLLPVLFLGKLLSTLRDIQELPNRLEHCFSGFRRSFDDYHRQFTARVTEAKRKRKLSELISLGKDFREILRLVRDTDELASAVGGAMLLGNPVFLVLMLVASGATALLVVLAVATLLIFLL